MVTAGPVGNDNLVPYAASTMAVSWPGAGPSSFSAEYQPLTQSSRRLAGFC